MVNGARRFSHKLRHPFSALPNDPTHEEFWALKDISFDIKQGDRVGIIGRNGAGKSTLLKILSRITEPTSGRVNIKGRVASLLEVGTGFHPELTGRENIFLNGAILGMSKADIKKKFDEIVAFAEVEKFLDTPVKRYSSGMYVRLAFAVAAHLEPEILVIDEVLAVGDIEFQKKCLGKMRDVNQDGRTVIFVSHNMGAIEQLCSSILLLDRGKRKAYGANMQEIVKQYLFGAGRDQSSSYWENESDDFENEWFQPIKVFVSDDKGNPITGGISNSEDFYLCIEGIVQEYDPALQVGFAIYDENGALLFWSFHTDINEKDWSFINDKGYWTFRVHLPKRFLNEGTYRIDIGVALYCRAWLCEPGVKSPSIFLEIQGGLSDSPYWLGRRPGALAPILDWKMSKGT
jgi:lipopolysaccharide transport system ATP-binding protein